MDALALELPILWGLAQLFEQTLILQSLCVDYNMLVVVLKTRVQGYQIKPSSSVYVPRFNSVAPKIFLQYKYCMWKHSHSPTWKVRAFGDDALNPFTIISAVTERDIRYNLSRSCCDPEVLRCFVDPKNSKRPWVKSQVGFHSIAGAWWWFPKKNEPSLTSRVGKGREVFTIIYPDLLPFMMVL